MMKTMPNRLKVFLLLMLVRLAIAIALVIAGLSFAQTTIQTGDFVGGGWLHKAAGDFNITEQADERILSFSEDFKVNRGPDLFVWLVKGDNTKEYVNLGRLQSRKGEQQYVLPADVNLEDYDRIIIWCRAFRVLFASAEFDQMVSESNLPKVPLG